MSLTIASILAESAERHPDNTAVVLGDLRLSYTQLWAHTKQYAAVLRERGIGAGDKVALLLPNTPHFPLAYFGTLALGAVAVPVHALLKAEEIEYVLSDSGAKVLVCAAPLLGEGAKGAELAGIPVLAVMDGGDAGIERIDELALSATPIDALVPRDPDDTAVILYTSGTTGKPKGAELTHFNVSMPGNCSQGGPSAQRDRGDVPDVSRCGPCHGCAQGLLHLTEKRLAQGALGDVGDRPDGPPYQGLGVAGQRLHAVRVLLLLGLAQLLTEREQVVELVRALTGQPVHRPRRQRRLGEPPDRLGELLVLGAELLGPGGPLGGELLERQRVELGRHLLERRRHPPIVPGWTGWHSEG